ncbi:Dcp1p-Dcp2p decapping enzyme complex alpha subunit [Apophysomyces ossiformis]|uniref:mRNA guanylyltransferase n=1 Tax=Apophysomyces ossiformis TaxID=679940 RepID=A0A8H7ER75_9FUNG|nr:Dcp1p-Dcp2p decapping enzyme complex alpha subunit [Apophysomyces ossiformis]
MAINGVSVIHRSFNTRLGKLQQDVLSPFNASQRQITDPSKSPPFQIELKKMERGYGVQLVFDQMARLKHKSDGVIFTPVKCPYVPGICEKLLKWKPPELNTVDFRIAAKFSKEHKLIYSLEVLSHGVTYKFFDHFQPETGLAQEWRNQPPDKRIAEFRYDEDLDVTIVEQGYAPITRKGGWRFVRFREDKDTANDENVVNKIMASIRDGVTKEQLLQHMDDVRAAWKAREKRLSMPHISSKAPDVLSLSMSSTYNSASLITPTSASPVFPSPSAGSSAGYFRYESESMSASRHNSMDMGSMTQRRKSEADLRPSSMDSKSLNAGQENLAPISEKEPTNKREVTVLEGPSERKRRKSHKEDQVEPTARESTEQIIKHEEAEKMEVDISNDLHEPESHRISAEAVSKNTCGKPSHDLTSTEAENVPSQQETKSAAEHKQSQGVQSTDHPSSRQKRNSPIITHSTVAVQENAQSLPEPETKIRMPDRKTPERVQSTHPPSPLPAPARSPSKQLADIGHAPNAHYAHTKYTEENGTRPDHRSKSIPDAAIKMRQSSTSNIHSLLTTSVEPLSSTPSSRRNNEQLQHPCNFETILGPDKREYGRQGARQFINFHADGSQILATSASSKSSHTESYYGSKAQPSPASAAPPPPAWQPQTATVGTGQQVQHVSPTHMTPERHPSMISAPSREQGVSWKVPTSVSLPSGYPYPYPQHAQQHHYMYDNPQYHRQPSSAEGNHQQERHPFVRPVDEQRTDSSSSKTKRSSKAMLDFILN